MTKTELLAAAHWLERDGANCERHLQIALELREYAATLGQEPVGTVTHAGHVDWYDQPPPAVWTKLYLHPPAPMTLTQGQIMEYVREAGLDWHRGWVMGEPPVNRYEEFARAVLATQEKT